ncbi:YbaB/EbfC family nucleoid-associated protein [Gordonia sp. VNK21]|uniref:YbaB/EbfC family nucleoid-associated protein n=1 Tax=Gordonia sp. VNK21 TaxID=3382483 RepID=UPI0038D3E59C
MTDAFDPSALFGGGSDNPMAGLLAQAQEMQSQLLKAQDEIAASEITGSAGNGLITVTGKGTGEVTAVTISPDVVDPSDVETLQDLVVGALADLARQRDELTSQKMGPLAGGLGGGLPGLG